MNPLIGPKLDKQTILIMAREWVNKILPKVICFLFINVIVFHYRANQLSFKLFSNIPSFSFLIIINYKLCVLCSIINVKNKQLIINKYIK